MSLRFLCEEITWSKQVFLPLNDLIKATLERKDFLNQLESLITLSARLIRKEIVNVESLPNIKTFVNLLEEFIFNLNEIHASSDKALPDFDVKITPLIYKFAELVVVQSRLSDCQKEYEVKLVRFLNSLPIHPTLDITPCLRTAAFLTSLLSDEISEEPDIQTPDESHNDKLVTTVNPPEQSENKEDKGSTENVTKKDGDLKEVDEINAEPSVIPETPLKSSEPTCVGVAAIRGIIPFSSGSFFSLTPPITESTDVCLSVKHQVENQANFPTPSRTPPLTELQKVLRERFPTPFITPTEKKARREVMRTLRSNRRPQLSSWNVVETRSPARSCNLRKQLFIDTDSLSNSANFSSSPLALYLSPDTEKDTPKFSSPDGPSPASSRKSSRKSSTSENKTKSPVNEKNGESYTELKKSIEGNLMGCEASLSDVELMDEIESSINMDNDVIFVESTYKTDDHAKIDYIMPESVSIIYQDANLDESSKSSNHSANKKTLSRSSQEERRRSSRLAGIPLPLIYSTEPLPDCRRSISSKRTPLQQLTSSKDNEVLSSSTKKRRTESVYELPIQPLTKETPIAEATPPSQLVDRRQTATWKQIRLQIPPCWADLIENHIKENHPDEKLWYQEEESARWPIVYCNCAQSKRD